MINTKEGKKRGTEGEKADETNRKQNGRPKSNQINNYIKFKLTKHSNQKSETFRLSDWMKKQDSIICCLQETHFKYRDVNSVKIEISKKICLTNCKHKKARMTILIKDKIEFKRSLIRGSEGHFIMTY